MGKKLPPNLDWFQFKDTICFSVTNSHGGGHLSLASLIIINLYIQQEHQQEQEEEEDRQIVGVF